MNRKLFILALIAISVAGVLLASRAIYLDKRPRDPSQIVKPALNTNSEGQATPPEIKQGNLELKYLTGPELELLGLKLDLSSVKYLAKLDEARWALGCPGGMDCIPAITEPQFTSAAEADQWLKPDDLVLAVTWKGIARAYPIRILDFHEIVNDSYGDEAVVITYCPLCGSGLVFKRPKSQGTPLEFGVSGRLYNANLLMYDRQTGSLWNQLTGEVVAGPLVGEVGRLERIPADNVSWDFWKQAHPETQVLARPTRVRTPRGPRSLSLERYNRYPYDEYQLKPQVGFGVDIGALNLRGMNAKRKIVGLVINSTAKAYVEFAMKEQKLLNDIVGGEDVLIVYTPADEIKAFKRSWPGLSEGLEFELREGRLVDKQTGTVWGFDGRPLAGPLATAESQNKLEEIFVTPAYWFAWAAFYPDSELYPPP